MGDKTWEQACFLGLLMMVHEVVTEDMQFFFSFFFLYSFKNILYPISLSLGRCASNKARVGFFYFTHQYPS